MTTATAGTPTLEKSAQTRNLILALLAFTITFWAWNLIGPLGVRYTTELGPERHPEVRSGGDAGAGRLAGPDPGRRPDRPLRRPGDVHDHAVRLDHPVLLVALAGALQSYGLLLTFGFLLGVAGTTFAIGIPFVNAWYEKPRRGFATGVFGMRAWVAPRCRPSSPRGWCSSVGYVATHVIIAIALAVVGVDRLVDDARLPALVTEHRPGDAQARRRGQARGDLADGLPVRRHLRRLRRLLDLPADLPQGRLRLRPHRRPVPGPPASPSPRSSPGRSAASCPTRSGHGR